jgi:hypothetical protein
MTLYCADKWQHFGLDHKGETASQRTLSLLVGCPCLLQMQCQAKRRVEKAGTPSAQVGVSKNIKGVREQTSDGLTRRTSARVEETRSMWRVESGDCTDHFGSGSPIMNGPQTARFETNSTRAGSLVKPPGKQHSTTMQQF